MTDIVGRFVPAHSDADEIKRLMSNLDALTFLNAILRLRVESADKELTWLRSRLADALEERDKMRDLVDTWRGMVG